MKERFRTFARSAKHEIMSLVSYKMYLPLDPVISYIYIYKHQWSATVTVKLKGRNISGSI